MTRKSRLTLNHQELLSEISKSQSIDLLKALHVLTADGQLNADSRRKLKQIYHLFQLIEPSLKKLVSQQPLATLVDCGAGKSYLGFILYDLFLKHQPEAQLVAIESRLELVAQCKKIAEQSGFDRVQFVADQISTGMTQIDRADMVLALHACDSATDDAIDLGITKQSSYIVVVPCCQAELSRSVDSNKAKTHWMAPLIEHPIQKREFCSHLTNVLRCLRLEAHGYSVTVTELVGWEHSLKNEMIIATKKGEPLPDKVSRYQTYLNSLPLIDTCRERWLK